LRCINVRRADGNYQNQMAQTYRYAAFISYSSKDARFARRLHRALEGYGIPTSLGKFDLTEGGKKNRVYPVFRDREELPSGELGEVIQAALAASAALIVVCSPHAAASPWVNKEIESFLALGRRDRIFPIIAENAPLVDAVGGDATRATFPPTFVGEGQVGKFEPLAADARAHKDGFRNAYLKIIAGLIGVNTGALQDRDRKRRRAWRRAATASGVLAAISAIALYSQHVFIQREVDRWMEFRIAVTSPELLRRAEPGAIFLDCVDHGATSRCPTMVVIPAGEFLMGSAESDPYHRLDQGPQRTIVVHRFALSQTEITIGQWEACVSAGGCTRELGERSWSDDQYPATGVSWVNAQEYVAWLSSVTGQPYRLPTEAEWEYAARAAASTDAESTRYSWGNEDPTCEDGAWDARAQFGDCVKYYSYSPLAEGVQEAEPALSFSPNAFGLYGMHGNAFEWVQDCYTVYDPSRTDAAAVERANTQVPGYAAFASWSGEHSRYTERRNTQVEARDENGLLDREAVGREFRELLDSCSLRVLRGGSFITPAWALTSAYREGWGQFGTVPSFGFRVARSIAN
jgi:formylglycine-generating enzyme required for sulfatase activity